MINMMYKKNLLLISFSLLFVINSWAQNTNLIHPYILPSPEKIVMKKGTCCLEKNPTIINKQDSNIPAEGYKLNILPEKIVIHYSDKNGLIYANHTLNQLKFQYAPFKRIPCMSITDSPRVCWRSFMLDSGRQYQSVSTIKKYIELASILKMNRFHWHLTEGLGWRIEIKKYPNLTKIGAFVGKDVEQQGFYTQDEIREIVNFAAEKGITIVPEIDMPGHAEAALYAYPEMGCLNIRPEIPETGFTSNIFCAGKESTISFLKDILDEICELFPSKYIHLGGDEAPKGNWDKCPHCKDRMTTHNLKNSHQLQQWFSAEMANYLNSKERIAIFWEDVIYQDDYKLPDNIVIQWWNWRTNKDLGFRNAIKNNHPVICNTNYYTYLNFPTSPWRGYAENRTFNLNDVYLNNPSYLPDNTNPLVLGMSCSLWTDYLLTEDLLDERIFPRIFALAEQMWHKGKLMNFSDFQALINEKKAWFQNLNYKCK